WDPLQRNLPRRGRDATNAGVRAGGGGDPREDGARQHASASRPTGGAGGRSGIPGFRRRVVRERIRLHGGRRRACGEPGWTHRRLLNRTSVLRGRRRREGQAEARLARGLPWNVVPIVSSRAAAIRCNGRHGGQMTNGTRSASTRRPAMLLVLAAALLPSGSPAASKIQQDTLIHLADGDVQGTVDTGTRQFLGIPYAAPPLGTLRWRPPQPAIPWSNVLQANAFASACAQLASIQGPASENEDCLYL